MSASADSISCRIAVDESQRIVAVRTCGIAEINDRNVIAVILGSHRTVITSEVPLAVKCQKAHPAGAGVFQIRVEEKRCLANTEVPIMRQWISS